MKPTLAQKWLATPPAQWSQSLNLTGWQPGSRHDVSRAADWQELIGVLESMSSRAAMLAAYIETRTGADGCGEKEHADAVKAANRILARVRKAQGFTDPKSGCFTF